MNRVRKTVSWGALLALAWWIAGGAHAAEILNRPAPFVPVIPGASPGVDTVRLAAAQRAHDLGLSSLAASLYREILDEPGADRAGLTLALATALLDAGRAAEAEQALAALPEPHDVAWHLRAGLAAVQLGKYDAARAELAQVQAEEGKLSGPDLPWYWFLQGQLVDLAPVREERRANDFYIRAERGASNELAGARFQLAAEQLRLRMSAASPATLKVTFDNYERHRGTAIGFRFAEAYATGLDQLGRRNDAVAFLQTVLLGVPLQEREWWDRLHLLLGLIGDRGRSGIGQHALVQLLERGNNPVRQRQALHLLAEGSREDAVARRQLRAELDRLLAAKPPHPIAEDLRYFRAQLALIEGDYVHVEDHANALLKDFPGSALRVHAFSLLTQSAWEQRRFRPAANSAMNARKELPTGEAAGPAAAKARTHFGIVAAEAWFRAGLGLHEDFSATQDFRNAAETYADVLRDPAGIEESRVSELMLQCVLSEIKAGSPEAGRVLDEFARDRRFRLQDRWQAEWSLARGLQLHGEAGAQQAYARVNKLLGGSAVEDAVLTPELRARMAWLQAELALDTGRPEQTLRLAGELERHLAGVGSDLRKEIASASALLKAKGEFALSREPAALETLAKLRADHPASDAAIYSYLIEAAHYAVQEKIDLAQKQLTSLVDNERYKNSEYVPYALFQLALLAERLGKQENLEEANRRIEELVKLSAVSGQGDLIFAARLKQGDLLRKLNQFPQAQRAYEDLVNRYPRRPDVVFAQLALAETINAQSSTDPANAEVAQLKFEEVRDRVDAPADVRVEAGYNLGALLRRRGKFDEAAKVWWSDVVQAFLEKEAKPFLPADKRPYWYGRTLWELGNLYEQQEKFEDARRVYRLLIDKQLSYGENLARAALRRLGGPVAQGQ